MNVATQPFLASQSLALQFAGHESGLTGVMDVVPASELELPSLRYAWDALAECTVEPNPFLESWYLLPALRELTVHRPVSLLRLTFDGELAGLLPIVRERSYYGRPVPHLSAWLHGNCFLGAPLVAGGLERAFWRALFAWADNASGSAVFLHLAGLPLDGAMWSALQDVVAEQGRPAALVHREDRALLQSDFSPEAYFEASMSGKKRKELRRQHARLSELGVLNFERSRDGHDLEPWCSKFLALEKSGWKGHAGSALGSDHGTEQLFRKAMSGAAQRGRLERLTMTLDGEPIAMLINFITPPGAFSYKTAFDERFARFSPGVLIQRENLQILNHPDVRWVDSCAAADHPMIERIWREKRAIGRVSVAIGGPLRRMVFAQIARAETGRPPASLLAVS